MILVTAAGIVGQSVVDQLFAAGRSVRVFSGAERLTELTQTLRKSQITGHSLVHQPRHATSMLATTMLEFKALWARTAGRRLSQRIRTHIRNEPSNVVTRI